MAVGPWSSLSCALHVRLPRPRDSPGVSVELAKFGATKRTVGVLNRIHDTSEGIPRGIRDDNGVQKVVEGKSSYELSWIVKVMISIYKRNRTKTGANERPNKQFQKIPAKLCLDSHLWAQFCSLFF